MKFLNNLNAGKKKEIMLSLQSFNKGPSMTSDTRRSRTLCLFDATGSMSSLIAGTKSQIVQMFDRAQEVLEKCGLDRNLFSMQIAVYRNYDCDQESLLESSSWECDARNLRSFLERISCKGGWGCREAMEIGLWHAKPRAGAAPGRRPRL